MDTTFLLAYAVGLYISGILGDRFNLTRVLAFGMCSSAVMVRESDFFVIFQLVT